MSEPVIRLHGVWKIFGDRVDEAMRAIAEEGLGKPEVLERFGCVVGIADCSFEVPRGEIFCVMGLSGSGKSTMVRVVVYNTDALDPSELPASILELTDPKWRARVAWAPTNGSFQAWVTALRVGEGEDGARAWLEGMRANAAPEFPNNSSIVEAVGRGEVDAGLVNHYYLSRFLAEHGEDFPARNHHTGPGDIGTLVNVAGAGILRTSSQADAARRFLDFMLGEEAQRYYAETNAEYPLIAGVAAAPGLRSIADLEPPAIDLSDLADLEGTLRLLRETGVLP